MGDGFKVSGIKAAAAVTGNISSAVLTAISGEATLSSLAGAALGAVLDDVGTRTLSEWETRRIRDAATWAAEKVREHWEAGHDFRSDGFFEADHDSKSFFAEIAEGVLVAAQHEHEERKIPYMGSLIGNIAFLDNIDKGTANWALQTAKELTWTQYVLLAIVGREDKKLPDGKVGKPSPSWTSWSVHKQLEDLGYARRELVAAPSRKTERMELSIPDMSMPAIKLQSGGQLLFTLMSLHEVPDSDLQDVVDRLLTTETHAFK